MKYYFLVFLLTLVSNGFSQDTVLLQSWQDQAKSYINVNLDSSQYFGEQILNNSKSKDLKAYHAFALNWIGIVYMQKGVADSADYYFDKAIEYSSKNKEPRIVRMATFNISVNALNQGDFERAAETGLASLEVFKNDGDSTGIGKALYHIGSCYFSLNQWEEAEKYMQLALPVSQKHGSEWSVANIYGALGSIAFQEGDTVNGLNYTRKSIQYKTNAGGEYYSGHQFVNMSDVFLAQNKWDSCLYYLQRAEWASEILGDQQLLGVVYTQKSTYFNQTDQIDSALFYAHEGLKTIEVTNDNYTKQLVYYRLFEAYNKDGNLDSAIYYQTQYYNLRDSIQGEDTKERIANLDANYQLAEKERELLSSELALEKGLRERDLVTYAVIGLFLILVAVLLIWNYRRKKQLFESELKLANEKNRIAMDLHDHVGAELTLASSKLFSESYDDGISNQRRKELEKVGTQLRDITELLRETVWSIQESQISIKDLISKIDAFQAKLFQDSSLDFKSNNSGIAFDFPSEIAIEVYRIFQEGIHNSFKYANATELELTVHRVNNTLDITLKDNGVGFKQETNRNLGFGLTNMNKRAQKINAPLTIKSELNKGTEIKLVIPIS